MAAVSFARALLESESFRPFISLEKSYMHRFYEVNGLSICL